MIDPQTITTLSTITAKGLSRVLDNSGYTGCSFEDAVFVGINQDGNFVYEVQYYDDAGTGNNEQGYVFVSYDHEKGAITADF
jgi:hypothetical protein